MKRSTRVLLALGIVLALIFSSLVAWGVFLFERERRAAIALENAEKAFEKKDFDGALTLLSRTLEMHLFPAQKATAYYRRAWLESQKFRHDEAIRDYTEAFESFDVLVSPTSPTTAFRIGERTGDPMSMYLSDVFTIPANLAGVPAISVPCGVDDNGLPIGFQIVAPILGERVLLRAANALEAKLGLGLRPPIAA